MQVKAPENRALFTHYSSLNVIKLGQTKVMPECLCRASRVIIGELRGSNTGFPPRPVREAGARQAEARGNDVADSRT
jgi:hypothetical protein